MTHAAVDIVLAALLSAVAAVAAACPGAFAASAASLQVIAGKKSLPREACPAFSSYQGDKECLEHFVIRPKLASTKPAQASLHSDRLFGMWADICRPFRDLAPEEQPVLAALKFHI